MPGTLARASEGAPAIERLSHDPRVDLLRGFLDAAACDSLASAVGTGLLRIDTAHRSAQIKWIDGAANSICRALQSALAQAVGLPVENAEPFQVTVYRPFEFYAPHLDSYEAGREGAEYRRAHGERLVTALTYIGEPVTGGETVFPQLGLRIAPSKGAALIFDLCRRNTRRADPRSVHAGEKVTAGKKVILTTWFHDRPFQWSDRAALT